MAIEKLKTNYKAQK